LASLSSPSLCAPFSRLGPLGRYTLWVLFFRTVSVATAILVAPSLLPQTEPLLCFALSAIFLVDGIVPVHKNNRAECLARFGPVLVVGMSAGAGHVAVREGGGRLCPFCFFALTAILFLVDGNDTFHNKTRAECLGRYRYRRFTWTYINSDAIAEVLSSAREFHWSCSHTRALGDSSSCIRWHSILYDLYTFALDLCISW